MSFIQKIQRFMQGRYISDSLNKFIFWLYVAVIAVNIFNLGAVANTVLSIAGFILAAIYILRALSRNIVARSAENRRYLRIKSAITGFFGKKRYARDKGHVFRECPHCGARLRLPHKRGKHTVHCPKCSNSFDVKIVL